MGSPAQNRDVGSMLSWAPFGSSRYSSAPKLTSLGPYADEPAATEEELVTDDQMTAAMEAARAKLVATLAATTAQARKTTSPQGPPPAQTRQQPRQAQAQPQAPRQARPPQPVAQQAARPVPTQQRRMANNASGTPPTPRQLLDSLVVPGQNYVYDTSNRDEMLEAAQMATLRRMNAKPKRSSALGSLFWLVIFAFIFFRVVNYAINQEDASPNQGSSSTSTSSASEYDPLPFDLDEGIPVVGMGGDRRDVDSVPVLFGGSVTDTTLGSFPENPAPAYMWRIVYPPNVWRSGYVYVEFGPLTIEEGYPNTSSRYIGEVNEGRVLLKTTARVVRSGDLNSSEEVRIGLRLMSTDGTQWYAGNSFDDPYLSGDYIQDIYFSVPAEDFALTESPTAEVTIDPAPADYPRVYLRFFRPE